VRRCSYCRRSKVERCKRHPFTDADARTMIAALKFLLGQLVSEKHHLEDEIREHVAEIERMNWWRESDRMEIDSLTRGLSTAETAVAAVVRRLVPTAP
jgi:hypothetical protein